MMEVPRGVLSMLPPAPRGLQATSRQSFPGGGAGLAASKLPLPNDDEEKFLPRIASNTGPNRGASMPGYSIGPPPPMHKSNLGGPQHPLGDASRLRESSGIFAHPNSKAQPPLPEKAFAEREDFKPPWSIAADQGKGNLLSQVMSRLDALECSRGPSTGADPSMAARVKALEDGLSQMQQTQLSLQQHDKTLLKKLALVEQQVVAMEQRMASGEQGGKPEAAAKGQKIPDSELSEIKSSLAQLAQHDKSLKEHQKQLQDMSAALSKLQQPAANGRRKQSDSGGPGDAGKKGAAEVDGRIVALEARLQAQEAAAGSTGKAVAAASSAAAAALDAANQAQATANASAAAATAATDVIPNAVKQAITSVVGPLVQENASQLAVLAVRVEEGEQQVERSEALMKELQGAIDQLQQQQAAGGPAAAPGPASAVEAKILLAIGAKVDKINEHQNRLVKQVEVLTMQVDGLGVAGADAGARRLDTVHEESGEVARKGAAPAAASDDARAAQQTANQALAASSRALTQASQALSQASGANEELGRVQSSLSTALDRLARVEELSNQAAGFASMAHQNVAGMEQVAKSLVVKIDTLSKEMVVVQAKQNHTPALASAAPGPGAAQFQDGASGSDPRVPAILVDLRQLAGGLGELAGRISVTERELAMTLPTLARVQALKDLENTLLDKQQQALQDVEAIKRGMQTAQMQSWQQGHMGGAVHSPVTSMSMGYMPPGMQTSMLSNMTGMMGMGETQGHGGGGGGGGRSLAKSNSVVLRRSESKRVANPSATRL